MEERQLKAADSWIKAKRSLRVSGAFVLFIVLAFAFLAVYAAGYIGGEANCTKAEQAPP